MRTKIEFENEINAQTDNSAEWEGYEAWLYQQHAYPDMIEEMFEYFNSDSSGQPTMPETASELLTTPRKWEKGIESSPNPFSSPINDLQPKSVLDIIWKMTDHLSGKKN